MTRSNIGLFTLNITIGILHPECNEKDVGEYTTIQYTVLYNSILEEICWIISIVVYQYRYSSTSISSHLLFFLFLVWTSKSLQPKHCLTITWVEKYSTFGCLRVSTTYFQIKEEGLRYRIKSSCSWRKRSYFSALLNEMPSDADQFSTDLTNLLGILINFLSCPTQAIHKGRKLTCSDSAALLKYFKKIIWKVFHLIRTSSY